MSDTFQIAVHIDGETEGVLHGLNEKLARVLWSALRDANQEVGNISVSMKGDERRQGEFQGFARGDFIRVRGDSFADHGEESPWYQRRGREGLVLGVDTSLVDKGGGSIIVDLAKDPDRPWEHREVWFQPKDLERLP